MATKNRGFTLIEILVVITIIAGLMGMGFVIFGKSQSAKDELLTRQRINAISAALESLASPNLLGSYPPADIRLLRGLKGENIGKQLGLPNETNLGAESIYVALFLQGHSVTIEMEEDWLKNTDGDQMSTNLTRTQSTELFEFVDKWDNPLAYFSVRELKNFEAVKMYKTTLGPVEVKPWMNAKLGTPMNAGKFQLFSAGPDQTFNTEDDIKSWE